MLSLGKVIAGIRVQRHLSELLERRNLLGDNLCRVEDVEAVGLGLVLVDELHGEFPLGGVTGVNVLPEILAVEVDVRAGGDLGLFPQERGLALESLPVELYELGDALISDEAVCVDAEAVLFARTSTN